MKPDENAQWQYNANGKPPEDSADEDESNSDQPSAAPSSNIGSINWQAPEFIAHTHSTNWYLVLFVGSAAFAATVFFLTKDYFATGTIVAMGVIVSLAANRKPGLANYVLADDGISINGKSYPFKSFRSFSILSEGELSSINFSPLKRFMPMVSIYINPADEKKITEAIGDNLPFEQHQMDTIDRISRRLHF